MRIIGGRLRGQALAGPGTATGLRPTADRVRESLFNLLAHGPYGDPPPPEGRRVVGDEIERGIKGVCHGPKVRLRVRKGRSGGGRGASGKAAVAMIAFLRARDRGAEDTGAADRRTRSHARLNPSAGMTRIRFVGLDFRPLSPAHRTPVVRGAEYTRQVRIIWAG